MPLLEENTHTKKQGKNILKIHEMSKVQFFFYTL